MQAVKDGFQEKSTEFNPEEISMMFKNKKVEHVEVFRATDENLKKAKNREGKKFNYSCGNGYKKAPKIKKP